MSFVLILFDLADIFTTFITVHYCSKYTVTVTVMDTVLPVMITGNHYFWTLYSLVDYHRHWLIIVTCG
jgi:hypothetical protein